MPDTFFCIDFETSTLEEWAEVIEIGTALLSNGHVSGCVSALVAPELLRVDPLATAVHGLRTADLRHKPSFTWAWQTLCAPAFAPPGGPEGPAVYAVAHNASYEQFFIDPELLNGAPWICTYKCALDLLPDAPAYGLRDLFHWLLITDDGEDLYELAGIEIDFNRVWPAHRAGPDAYVNAVLLAVLLGLAPAEHLVEVSARPARLRRVSFGKHRGMIWDDLPTDYLYWILRQADFDEDSVYTAKAVLTARGMNFALSV